MAIAHIRGLKVKELRVGTDGLQSEQETVVEERIYTWSDGKWTMFHEILEPSRAVIQLHWLPRHSGQDKRYELAFGAGDDSSDMKWSYAHKPIVYTVERLPTCHWYIKV